MKKKAHCGPKLQLNKKWKTETKIRKCCTL